MVLGPTRGRRFADALTVGLGALSAVAFLYPFHIRALNLAVHQWWRPAIAAAVIGVVRHALVREPSLPVIAGQYCRTIRDRFPGLWTAVVLTVTTRIGVLIVGYVAVVMIPFPQQMQFQSMGPYRWWDLPNRWDAGWYLSIAANGYEWTGDVSRQQNVVFFPAYPMLVRAASTILPSALMPPTSAMSWTATGVSIAAFFCASLYLFHFCAGRFGRDVAGRAVVLLATYPFAVFYSGVYTESLFLLCCIGAWYHFSRDELTRAAGWALIAGLSRPNGAILALPLLALAWTRPSRRLGTWVAAVAPVLGTAVFTAYTYHLTGRPLVWLEVQRAGWNRSFQGLDQTIWREVVDISRIGILRYVGAWPSQAFNVGAAAFALASVYPVARRVGTPLAIFVAANVVLPLLNGGFQSLGRFTATLFPIFIWLATMLDEELGLSACVCAFAMGQALVASLFFTWRPIY